MKPLADNIYRELYSRMESSLIISLGKSLNYRINYYIKEKVSYYLCKRIDLTEQQIITSLIKSK